MDNDTRADTEGGHALGAMPPPPLAREKYILHYLTWRKSSLPSLLTLNPPFHPYQILYISATAMTMLRCIIS